MKRAIAVVFLLIGMGIGGFGYALLPADHGRYEYVVQIADPRPPAESEMPASLAELGTVRVVVMEAPEESSEVPAVLLAPNMSELLGAAEDCALGRLPSVGEQEAVAGNATDLVRGPAQVADETVEIVGVLQKLGPAFDGKLVMDPSESFEAALREAGWEAEVHYLVLADTWHARGEVLARLETEPDLLPSPEARVVGTSSPPVVSPLVRTILAVALICMGVVTIAIQLRGFSRQELEGKFRRE